MIIKSMAGDFEFAISRFEREDHSLVIVGTMGVWEARTYISARELVGLFGKLLSRSVVFYVLTLPYQLLAHRD